MYNIFLIINGEETRAKDVREYFKSHIEEEIECQFRVYDEQRKESTMIDAKFMYYKDHNTKHWRVANTITNYSISIETFLRESYGKLIFGKNNTNKNLKSHLDELKRIEEGKTTQQISFEKYEEQQKQEKRKSKCQQLAWVLKELFKF